MHQQRHPQQRPHKLTDPRQRFARGLAPGIADFVELRMDIVPALFHQLRQPFRAVGHQLQIACERSGAHQIDRQSQIAGLLPLASDQPDRRAPIRRAVALAASGIDRPIKCSFDLLPLRIIDQIGAGRLISIERRYELIKFNCHNRAGFNSKSSDRPVG